MDKGVIMKKNYIIFYTCSIMMTVSMMAQAIDMSKVPNGVSKKSISLYLTAVAPEEMLQFRFAAVNAAFVTVQPPP